MNDSTAGETQSKVRKNTGHRRTRTHGALNSLFSQIMSNILKTISAWWHKQTNSDTRTPLVGVSAKAVFWLIKPRLKKINHKKQNKTEYNYKEALLCDQVVPSSFLDAFIFFFILTIWHRHTQTTVFSSSILVFPHNMHLWYGSQSASSHHVRKTRVFSRSSCWMDGSKNASDNMVGKNPFLEGLILLTRTHFRFCFKNWSSAERWAYVLIPDNIRNKCAAWWTWCRSVFLFF